MTPSRVSAVVGIKRGGKMRKVEISGIPVTRRTLEFEDLRACSKGGDFRLTKKERWDAFITLMSVWNRRKK